MGLDFLPGVRVCCFGVGHCWVARCSVTHHCLLVLFVTCGCNLGIYVSQGSECCSELPVILRRLCLWTKTALSVGVRCQLCWVRKAMERETNEHSVCYGAGICCHHTLLNFGLSWQHSLGSVSERRQPVWVADSVYYRL